MLATGKPEAINSYNINPGVDRATVCFASGRPRVGPHHNDGSVTLTLNQSRKTSQTLSRSAVLRRGAL